MVGTEVNRDAMTMTTDLPTVVVEAVEVSLEATVSR